MSLGNARVIGGANELNRYSIQMIGLSERNLSGEMSFLKLNCCRKVEVMADGKKTKFLPEQIRSKTKKLFRSNQPNRTGTEPKFFYAPGS